MNQIRLQIIHRSSAYIAYMPPRASLFSLESGSFRDDKGLFNGLLIIGNEIFSALGEPSGERESAQGDKIKACRATD